MAKYGFDLLGIDVSPLGWPSIERTPKEGNALCSAALLRRTFWLPPARPDYVLWHFQTRIERCRAGTSPRGSGCASFRVIIDIGRGGAVSIPAEGCR